MNEIANDQRVADGIEFYTTVEQMQNHYAHLDHTDLSRDVFLVELEGSLVGYVLGGVVDDEAAVRAYEPIVFVDLGSPPGGRVSGPVRPRQRAGSRSSRHRTRRVPRWSARR